MATQTDATILIIGIGRRLKVAHSFIFLEDVRWAMALLQVTRWHGGHGKGDLDFSRGKMAACEAVDFVRICQVLRGEGWGMKWPYDIDGFADMDLLVEDGLLVFADSDDAEEVEDWLRDDKAFYRPLYTYGAEACQRIKEAYPEVKVGSDELMISQEAPTCFEVFIYRKGVGAVTEVHTYKSLAQAIIHSVAQFNSHIEVAV